MPATVEGAHHPALNPYTLPESKGLRLTYADDLGKGSLNILNRTVMIAMNPAFPLPTVREPAPLVRRAEVRYRLAVRRPADHGVHPAHAGRSKKPEARVGLGGLHAS